jgi:hypothetical protein
MHFDVNGTSLLPLLIIPAALGWAVLSWPRWYVRSISKHALWRMRDGVAREVRTGRLPGDHAAVAELRERIDWAIKETHSFDLVHLLVAIRALHKLPAENRQQLSKTPSLHGLTGEQVELIKSYRRRYNTVTIRALLLSSWIGIATFIGHAVPFALKRVGHRARNLTVAGVVNDTTDEMVARSWLGRQAREFINSNGPQGSLGSPGAAAA